MDEDWQFSPSSIELLKRCIAAPTSPSRLNQTSRKWMALFKPCTEIPELKIKEECTSANNSFDRADKSYETIPYLTQSVCVEDTSVSSQNVLGFDHPVQEQERFKIICDNLEKAPDKLEYVTEICYNHSMLSYLAENLTKSTVEDIFDSLLNRTDVDDIVIAKFLKEFFPVYIEKERGSLGIILDLLIKYYQKYKEPFYMFVDIILMRSDTNSKILEEFFKVNKAECTEYLKRISQIDKPKELFIYHMKTYHMLYKNSDKTIEIQNFVLQCLLKSSEDCRSDKNYGQFMYTFFQSVKDDSVSINRCLLATLLRIHDTPFKRLCATIFNGLKKDA